MNGGRTSLLRYLRKLTARRQSAEHSDEQLLSRYVAQRDETAFETLLQRHGPLVWGVCRRSLADAHEAEDAFQATFLVLARRAGAIVKRASVRSWLHGVAYRIAQRSRERGRRERARLEAIDPVQLAAPSDADAWRQLQPILDEELSRLPEKYRAPLLLCCLHDQTIDEAAQELGWSFATVKGRLQRGRELLRGRLQRRGLGLSAGVLGTVFTQGAVKAVPPTLLNATMNAAAAGTMTAPVAGLVKGAMQAMFWTKIKVCTLLVACLAISGVGVGMGLVRHHGAIAMTPAPEEARQPKKTEPKASEPVVRNGLEVVVKPTKAVFAEKEPLVFTVTFKNTSDKSFMLFESRYFWDWKIRFGDWQVFHLRNVKRAFPPSALLEPGTSIQALITLDNKKDEEFRLDWKGEQGASRPPARFLPVGKYPLVLDMKFTEDIRQERLKDYKFAHWTGAITTNAVEVEIAMPKEGDAKADLTDQQMAALAKETAQKGKFVELQEIRSLNQHLGGPWLLDQPFKQTQFWCVLQDRGLAAPKRGFLAVSRNGKVLYPFKPEDFAAVCQAEDRSKWTDAQYQQAAALCIHLTGTPHQDGWKILNTADEFMAIKFNMAPQNEKKRSDAAKSIEKPKVVKDKDTVQVRLWAWHLIGGALREWTVEFNPTDVKATSNEHGRFGGGGYD